jgi:glycosyltransferase involved in cell wall biosynthesis
MPKVSVIIPTYNRSHIISKTIGCVLSQSFDDLEILLIDDGSTDNTTDIVAQIQDSKIRYHKKENGGASSARNLGLEKSRGDFIAFLDSDDLWPKDYLAKMLVYFNDDSKLVVAYCLTTVRNDDGEVIDSDSQQRCYSGNITANLFVNSVVWPSGAVIRKKIANGVTFDESLKNSEDFDFFLRLSLKGHFVFVNDVKVFRGSSEDSLSNSCGINCSRILVLERFYNNLGGKSIIPRSAAMKKIGHSYRRIAECYRKDMCRSAALIMYKKAIGYYPADMRLYPGLLKTLCINKNNDKMPNWQIPPSLSVGHVIESEQQTVNQ